LALTKIIFHHYVIVIALLGSFISMVFLEIPKTYRLNKITIILIGALLVLGTFISFGGKGIYFKIASKDTKQNTDIYTTGRLKSRQTDQR